MTTPYAHPGQLFPQRVENQCGDPFTHMQDKRRRNDFASTEVGEVKGGRVTQQAFEVADKKDSGIRNSAMPGTRGDERKEAQENTALLSKGASLPFPSEPPNRVGPGQPTLG